MTSPGLTDEAAALVEPVALEAPHVRYAQLSKRGYLLLDIDEERLVAEYRHFDRVDEPDAESRQGAVLRVVPERAPIERVEEAANPCEEARKLWHLA